MSKFALMFLAVLLGGTVWALFYEGFAAYILYQIIFFLDPRHRWWITALPDVSYSFFASALMLFVLARNYGQRSKLSPWTSNPAFMWLIGLLLCYYLAYFWALDITRHERFTFIFLKLVVVVLTAYKLLDSKRALDWALWAYLIGCAYIGYLATITGRGPDGRVEGISLPTTGGDSNLVSAALVPAGALLLYYAWMGNKKLRLLSFACGALVVNGLVLFNSRGAFLGTVSSAGLYLIFMMFSKHRQPGQRGIAIFILIVAVVGAFHLTDKLFWERMSLLEKPHGGEAADQSRVLFWKAALRMMQRYPEGIGIFGFNILSSEYLTNVERGGVKYKAVHSLWFEGMTEVGWQGFFCFLAMLFTLYRLSIRASRAVLAQEDYAAYFKILALQCSLFGYLVSGTFINVFRSEILYWMVLLLSVAINVYYLQPMAEQRELERQSRRQKAKLSNEQRLNG